MRQALQNNPGAKRDITSLVLSLFSLLVPPEVQLELFWLVGAMVTVAEILMQTLLEQQKARQLHPHSLQ
jgi:hypothetical protein